MCFDHHRAKTCGIIWVCVLTIIEQKQIESYACVLTIIEQKIGIMWVCFEHYREKNWNHVGVF